MEPLILEAVVVAHKAVELELHRWVSLVQAALASSS
jgi:hypothetical protein